MKTGFGNSPVGSSNAGIGAPETTDALNTDIADARFIDPLTKDFRSVDVPGKIDPMPALRQRVLLALTTNKGSVANEPEFGSTLHLITHIDQTTPNKARAAVRTALARLTDVERLITIDDVLATEPIPGRLRIIVKYTSTDTAESETVIL